MKQQQPRASLMRLSLATLSVVGAASVAQAWMESRGHRQNMLSSSVTHFGIAYGPGPYWTMNAR